MKRLDAALARPAAQQHGLATRRQLREIGLSDEAIDVRIEAGVLRSVHPGVLHHAAAPFTERARLLASVLACGPTAVASHRSAAVLHGFDGIRRLRPEITVCDTTKPKLQMATIHRIDHLEPVDRGTVTIIPVTSPARTLLDLGAVVPYEAVEHAVQVAVIERRVDLRALVSVLDRVGKRGRRGTAALRAVVRHAIPDERLASMLEHDLHRLIQRVAVPPPVLQQPLVCADGREVVLDFSWPDRRIAVEADGYRWHATRQQLERDRARRRSIQLSGWAHYSYGWSDVHDRPSTVLTQLTTSLSP